MPWDSDGTSFTRNNGTQTGGTTWFDADAAGNNITTSQHDTHDQDLAQGIQESVNAARLLNSSTSTKGDALIGVKRTETGSSGMTLHAWIQGRHVTPEEFGALRDGSTNDTAAIREALDTGYPVICQPGVYGIDNLQIKEGDILIGAGGYFWQESANKPAGTDCTIFKYVGSGGANSVCVRASTAAVGTRPVYASDGSEDTFGWTFKHCIIDGDDTAEYGLYGARCGLGTTIDQVFVTGTLEHAAWLNEFWTASVPSLFALFNQGRGITIGYDTFSWGEANSIVNAVKFGLLQGFKNGIDEAYREASPFEGYGVGLWFNRSNVVQTVVGELNFGVGVIVSPRAGPNTIDSVYVEDNGYFDAAGNGTAVAQAFTATPWGVWCHNRTADGDTVNVHINNIFGASPSSRFQHVRLTGDSSGGFVTEPSEPWVFRNVYGIRTLTSDVYNYAVEYIQSALTDSSSTADLDKCLPQVGRAESIVGSATTLYVDDAASGNKSGRDTSNYMTLSNALACAKICSGVVTIDMSARASAPASAETIDGAGFTRRLTLSGGATGRFTSVTGSGPTFKNWAAELTVTGMAVVEFALVRDSRVRFNDCPIIRMNTSNTAGTALTADNSNVQIGGTSVINLTGSSATTKIALGVQGNSKVVFDNAAAGTITGHTTDDAIHFNEGAGEVHVSLTTATATWADDITRNTDGESGIVFAPDKILSAGGALTYA